MAAPETTDAREIVRTESVLGGDPRIEGTRIGVHHVVYPILEDFGADVDHRERERRVEQASASEFGVDDRTEVSRTENGEQGALFTSADEEQRTLDGEQAAGRSLF